VWTLMDVNYVFMGRDYDAARGEVVQQWRWLAQWTREGGSVSWIAGYSTSPHGCERDARLCTPVDPPR